MHSRPKIDPNFKQKENTCEDGTQDCPDLRVHMCTPTHTDAITLWDVSKVYLVSHILGPVSLHVLLSVLCAHPHDIYRHVEREWRGIWDGWMGDSIVVLLRNHTGPGRGSGTL